MSNRTRILTALLLVVPAVAAAQQQPQYQEVMFQFTVPVMLTKLHADVDAVRTQCTVGRLVNGQIKDRIFPPDPSTGAPDPSNDAWGTTTPLSDMALNAQGEYSANVHIRVPLMVPATFVGQAGGYECSVLGCLPAASSLGRPVGCSPFGTQAVQDPKLQVQTPTTTQSVVRGSFTF